MLDELIEGVSPALCKFNATPGMLLIHFNNSSSEIYFLPFMLYIPWVYRYSFLILFAKSLSSWKSSLVFIFLTSMSFSWVRDEFSSDVNLFSRNYFLTLSIYDIFYIICFVLSTWWDMVLEWSSSMSFIFLAWFSSRWSRFSLYLINSSVRITFSYLKRRLSFLRYSI